MSDEEEPQRRLIIPNVQVYFETIDEYFQKLQKISLIIIVVLWLTILFLHQQPSIMVYLMLVCVILLWIIPAYFNLAISFLICVLKLTDLVIFVFSKSSNLYLYYGESLAAMLLTVLVSAFLLLVFWRFYEKKQIQTVIFAHEDSLIMPGL